tara:strand:- start:2044 stop:2397 length:354 start_codon:yes stop_codon:yes gene_type:complete
MTLENRVLKPVNDFIIKNKLLFNGVSISDSIMLALSGAVMDCSMSEMEKIATSFADVQRIVYTGTRRSNPLRHTFDRDRFITNTMEIFSYVKSEQIVNDKALFVALNKVSQVINEEE